MDPDAAHRAGRPPADQQALVDDLAAVGIRVRTIWDLVNDSAPYPRAVPVLMSWLQRIDELPAGDNRDRLREGLVRALSVKEARPVAASLLVSQFRVVADPMLRWVVGNALAQTADHTLFADIAELVMDSSYGAARQMVVQALGRIGGRPYRDRVVELLVELLDDDDVVLHALYGVGTLKITSANRKWRSLASSVERRKFLRWSERRPARLRTITAAHAV
jgi:hypothetical protein